MLHPLKKRKPQNFKTWWNCCFRSSTAISTLQDIKDPYWLYLEALAWSESLSFSELEFLLDYLKEENWIKTDKTDHSTINCRITPVGYRYLNESEYSIRSSSQAFVAMWFDESMFQVYSDGIAPAIQDAGYEPLRIDQKEHVNKIDDEIIAEIRRAKFIVADFTHGDKGVYYEAGFAFGLNIPVIFTCRKDFINNVHFDTRQYAHIDWKDPQDLKERLTKRICSVIGDGPSKE